jgi:hypothetical protein
MYAIARRSNTDSKVLRFVMDKSVQTGHTSAAVQTFTSKKAASTEAKAKGEGFFVVALGDIPKAPKAKVAKV